jgi:tetratricopeptide (TPR) repeat protein
MEYLSPNSRQPKPFLRVLVALCLWLAAAAASGAREGEAATSLMSGAAMTLEAAGPSGNAANDAQARFMQGVKLANERKMAHAIGVFSELASDYPDFAEPHNNLGVLYEESGELDRARAALERAVTKDPQYATAHENLGDLYIRIASLFYEQALQIDPGRHSAQSIAAILTSVGGAPNRGRAVKFAEISAAAADAGTLEKLGGGYARLAYQAYSRARHIDPAAKRISLKLGLLEKFLGDHPLDAAPAAVAGAMSFSDDSQGEPQPETVSAPESTPAPERGARIGRMAEQEAPPAGPAQRSARQDPGDPLAVVSAWASAWSARDVPRYLSFYAPYFKTPAGQTVEAWKKARTARISGKSRIKVTVESPRIILDGDIAIVKYRQRYVSDRLRDTSGKILVLARRGDTWQIIEERAGS